MLPQERDLTIRENMAKWEVDNVAQELSVQAMPSKNQWENLREYYRLTLLQL